MMQNEEMETKLYNEGLKTWELKQIALKQQDFIRALELERDEYRQETKKCRREAQAMMTFCNYEVRQSQKIVGEDQFF
jgi:hypothetical protein